MQRVFLVIMAGVIVISTILFTKDGGSSIMADEMKIESIRGDVVELAGKGVFFKNKTGTLPAHLDNVYDLEEAEVIKALPVFEKFFEKYMANPRDYIAENVKLANVGLLKDEGVTYELANPKLRYFYDMKTGKVLVPELIESGDDDYLNEISPDTGYKVVETIKIQETEPPNRLMSKVHGSVRSGSSVYFYGAGQMKLAKRDELSARITDLSSTLGITGEYEILYIQASTSKAVISKGGEVVIMEIDL